MADTMYIHDVVIFNQVKQGNTTTYKATNLAKCFFSKTCKVTDTANGISLASVGTCLIPAFSLPTSAIVPPSEWQALSLDEILSQGLVTLDTGDIVAKGYCEAATLSAREIMKSYDAFTVQSITTDDFSSSRGFLLKGV